MNTAFVHSISTEISTETPRHRRPAFRNAAQVSNEATVASVTSPENDLEAIQLPSGSPSPFPRPLHILGNDRTRP